MDKSELFSLAPRRTAHVVLGRKKVQVRAISLEARLSLNEMKDLPLSEKLAWISIKGCPSLERATVEEVVDSLDPEAISKLSGKIMQLSGLGEAREAAAEKNSASDRK